MKVKGKQKIVLFLFLLGMICLLSGTSYAFYEVLYEGRTENKLEAGSFAIAFENKSDSITLDNAYPMSDEEGNKINPFSFSITNNGSLASRYQLSIEEDSKNTLSRGYLKYSLKRNDEDVKISSTLSSLVLVENQLLNPSATDNYELRIWIDEKTGNEAMNKIWKGKVKLVAHDHNVEYIEDHVAPTIKLSGNVVMDLHLNDKFEDPGIEEVIDNVDTSMDKSKVTKRYEYYDGEKVTSVNEVNTKQEGVYIIYYEIKDSNGNKGVAARTVNVVKVNKSAPTIELVGESTLTYARGDYYVERGATAKDEPGTDITNQIIVIHNLNLNVEEDQIVKYFVIDKDGNIGGATRKIQVVPAYKDGTNANEPKIVEGMIPVKYNKELQKWVKVDMLSDWYNYESQEWANAVTIGLDADGVGTTKRETYQKAEAGTAVEMEDINTMWVWIPRYEYNYVSIIDAKGELTNYKDGNTPYGYLNPGAIEINFISGTSSKVSDEDSYKMHPAFTFGDEELTGIWYGKFEPSNQEQIFDSGLANNSTLTPIIKPNASSWRKISISNAFYATLNMTSEGKAAKYGFKSGEIDTHMSKNSEWGAVAYLSQSKYGKYGNSNYNENSKEVGINGCGSYITGFGSSCDYDYKSDEGQKASTTGNITGVYDMSGGAWEFVMGALEDSSNPGKPTISDSEFVNNESGNKIPDAKYYDLYTGTTTATACNGGVCYGHALSETSAWYGDHHDYVTSACPWFNLSGHYGNSYLAGVFFFGYASGGPGIYSFRIVLAP